MANENTLVVQYNGTNIVNQDITSEVTKTLTTSGKYCEGNITVTARGSSGGGGSTKNIQAYHGMASVRTTSLSATGVKLTVAKTGTYKVSWIGARNNNQSTFGSRLYIGGTAYGTESTTFTNTYAQSVVLNNVSLTAGQEVEVRARARSTSYYMMVGNLVIEQTA